MLRSQAGRTSSAFSTIVLDIVRIGPIPGHGDAPHISLDYQLERYFELNALLAAGRRA